MHKIHVGTARCGVESWRGVHRCGSNNEEGRAIPQFALMYALVITNIVFFNNSGRHLITFRSPARGSDSDIKKVKDYKVTLLCEDCILT